MSRLVVFDLDGTLVDTAPDLVAAMNHALSQENLGALELAAARDLIGAGAKALVERGLAVHGRSVTPARLDELLHAFLVHYEAHIADNSLPFEGVIETLDQLEREGWRLAVCTNKLERYSRLLLDRLALSQRFAANCGGDTFPFKKPDGRHILETAARAGGASTTIMVGDSRTDVDAARNAGVKVIGVSFGYTTTPMRDLKPDAVIDHFADFAAALGAVAG